MTDDSDDGEKDHEDRGDTLVSLQLSELGLTPPPNGQTPPHGVPVIHPEQIINKISESLNDQIATQILEQLGGGGGGPPGSRTPPPPASLDKPREFLGLSFKDWGGFALKALVVLGTIIVTVYTTVQQGFEDRPTRTETFRAMDEKMGFHEEHGDHPEITEVLQQHNRQLKSMHDTQLRQTMILENQGETLKEIKEDVKSLNGRRRGRDHDNRE